MALILDLWARGDDRCSDGSTISVTSGDWESIFGPPPPRDYWVFFGSYADDGCITASDWSTMSL